MLHSAEGITGFAVGVSQVVMSLGRKLGIESDICGLFFNDAMSAEEVLDSLSGNLPHGMSPSYMQVSAAKF